MSIYQGLSPRDRQSFDMKLKFQRFPHFFNRKMKPFNDFAYVKAVEVRNVLFYGFLPLGLEFIDVERLSHFALFICAIRLYHSQPPMFGNDTPNMANKMFEEYYKDQSRFYKSIQNYTLHMHYHFADQYFRYGSLANIGCFGQEDLIGHIGSKIHGTRYYGDLIVNYYNVDFQLMNKTRDKKYQVISEGIDLNEHFTMSDYPLVVQHHDKLCGCSEIMKCLMVYRRCVVRNNIFHSLLYKRRVKSNSYFISYWKSMNTDINKFYGQIVLFFRHSNVTYAMIQCFPKKKKFSYVFRSSCYYPLLKKPLDNCFSILCRDSPEIFDIVNINNIQKHCIVFDFKQELVVTEISAYHEHD